MTQPKIPSNWKAKPIPGFPGYIVCFKGNVYSCRVSTGFTRKWRRLSVATPTTRNYRRSLVNLYRSRVKRVTREVGPLVLRSFVGPPPTNHECCHKNGDATDNRLCNLYWGTRKQNIQDAVKHGTHSCLRRGADSNRAILSMEAVVDIRSNYRHREVPLRIFADKYGVTTHCISKVLNGKNWSHVV